MHQVEECVRESPSSAEPLATLGCFGQFQFRSQKIKNNIMPKIKMFAFTLKIASLDFYVLSLFLSSVCLLFFCYYFEIPTHIFSSVCAAFTFLFRPSGSLN